MTIPLEKFKARLLANPKVKADYDALDPELETKLVPSDSGPASYLSNRRRLTRPRQSRTAAGS